MIGENSRPGDMPCNPTKRSRHEPPLSDKRLDNQADVLVKCPLRKQWVIAEEELVEATPQSVRMRKAVLDYQERRKLPKSKLKIQRSPLRNKDLRGFT